MRWDIILLLQFRKFLQGVETDQREKVVAYIRRFLVFLDPRDLHLDKIRFRPLGNGLYDLRVKERVHIRCFFKVYDSKKIILITHGMVKKTGKIDPEEVKRAIRLIQGWEKERS